MGIWILSQNENVLIYCKRIMISSNDRKKIIEYITERDEIEDYTVLGEYETIERTKEVFFEIVESVQCEYIGIFKMPKE